MSKNQLFLSGLLCLLGLLALTGCDLPNLSSGYNDGPDPAVYRGQPVKQWITELADDRTREGANINLSQLGPDDKELVPGLVALLKDSDPGVRRGACRLLGQIGANARDALEDLEEAFNDADIGVRKEAIRAYRRVMPMY
jgi:phosphotransferase system HPr-like phosphotransfer protein